MRTNRRPGPVNTNWGDKVGICKLKPWAEPVNTNLGVNTRLGARAGKYKFGARVGKHKVRPKAGKYKQVTRAGKYKLGARARVGRQAKSRGPGNTNTHSEAVAWRSL